MFALFEIRGGLLRFGGQDSTGSKCMKDGASVSRETGDIPFS
jgi:hypothetical protein